MEEGGLLLKHTSAMERLAAVIVRRIGTPESSQHPMLLRPP